MTPDVQILIRGFSSASQLTARITTAGEVWLEQTVERQRDFIKMTPEEFEKLVAAWIKQKAEGKGVA